jgi:putative transposase
LSVGKEATPNYAIIDSQSVKTTSKSEQRGFDGGKKVKGRKRHILVDTIGNLLGVVVHAGNIHDTKAGILVVNKVMKIYPSIQAISADAGYRKTFEKDVLDNYDIPVDISTKINGEWKIIPKRWIVERNFAWMNNFRRLTKDFEITVKSAESFVKIAHIAQILRMLKMTENALTQSYCFGNDIIRIQREFDLLRILSLLSAP